MSAFTPGVSAQIHTVAPHHVSMPQPAAPGARRSAVLMYQDFCKKCSCKTNGPPCSRLIFFAREGSPIRSRSSAIELNAALAEYPHKRLGQGHLSCLLLISRTPGCRVFCLRMSSASACTVILYPQRVFFRGHPTRWGSCAPGDITQQQHRQHHNR